MAASGRGPRYCPSIEDKIERFADKDRHQIFVEPEGWDTVETYINGFSTSLPEDVQTKALRAIPGFAHARMFRPGYAVEYDYFPPTQLKHTLETKLVKGSVLRWADQRHHRLRRSGLPRPDGRHQCTQEMNEGRPSPRPGRSLHRRADRRPHHQRDRRTLPHVHQPGRIPDPAAPGQCGHPPHPQAHASDWPAQNGWNGWTKETSPQPALVPTPSLKPKASIPRSPMPVIVPRGTSALKL
jgi:hypothetical protein